MSNKLLVTVIVLFFITLIITINSYSVFGANTLNPNSPDISDQSTSTTENTNTNNNSQSNIDTLDNATEYKQNIDRFTHKFFSNSGEERVIDLSELTGEDLSDESSYSFDIEKIPVFGTLEPVENDKFIYSTDLNNVKDHFEISQTDLNERGRIFIFDIYVGLEPIEKDHNKRILYSGLIALFLGAVLTLIVRKVFRKLKVKFFDMVRGQDMDPSLSLFQFLVWTWVVSFAFIVIFCIRIFSGAYSITEFGVFNDFDIRSGMTIPYNLLALIGISTAVPIASVLISKKYYESDLTQQNIITNAYKNISNPKEAEILNQKRRDNPFGKMLTEFGKPVLSRLQMFFWTFIAIFIYLFSLFGYVLANNQPIEIINLSIPDIDPTLVILMGISQTAFLGLKTVNSWMTIDNFHPIKVKSGSNLTIFGRNFGMDRDSVWIGDTLIKGSDTTHLVSWSDDRIDIVVPEIKPNNYDLIVVKKGSSVKADLQITIENSNTTVDNNTKLKPDETSSPASPPAPSKSDNDKATTEDEIKYFTYPPSGWKVKSDMLKEIAVNFDNITVEKESINDTTVIVTKIGDTENIVDKEKISLFKEKDLLIPLKKLEPNSKYRVTIGKDIKTKEGKTIGTDIIWDFETE